MYRPAVRRFLSINEYLYSQILCLNGGKPYSYSSNFRKKYWRREHSQLWDCLQALHTGHWLGHRRLFLLCQYHIQSPRVHPLQGGCNTTSGKIATQLSTASKGISPVHCTLPIVRFLSGKCNEGGNKDEKHSASVDGGEDEGDKEQRHTEAEAVQPTDDTALSPAAGQNGHSQELNMLSRKREQEPLQGNQSDQEKRTIDHRLQSLKLSFKRKLAKRVLSWRKIADSFDSFPYYISEDTKGILIDSAGARLAQPKYTKHGKALPSASHFILLRGPSGTEIYQEILIRALARHLKVSLLVLDSDFLAAKEYRKDSQFSETLSEDDDGDDEVAEEGEEEDEDEEVDEEEDDDNEHEEDDKEEEEETDSCEDWRSPGSNGSDDDGKGNSHGSHIGTWLEHVSKSIKIVELDRIPSKPMKYSKDLSAQQFKDITDKEKNNPMFESHGLKKGDKVKFIGTGGRNDKSQRSCPRLRKIRADKFRCHDKRILDTSGLKVGQLGVITSLSKGLPGIVGVKFDAVGKRGRKGGDGIAFIKAAELEKIDEDFQEKDSLALVAALCEMASSSKPIIIYFRDIQQWVSKAVPANERLAFIDRVGELLNKVNGPVVFICGRAKDNVEGSHGKSGGYKSVFDCIWSPMRNLNKRPFKQKMEREIMGTKGIFRLFENIIEIHPPKEESSLRVWREMIEEDKRVILQRKNQRLLDKVLSEHGMGCVELSILDTLDLCLTLPKAEKVVGWARNNYLVYHSVQSKDKKIWLPRECLEKALSRFKAVEESTETKPTDLRALTENEYENSLLSSVIPAQEIGIQFDQIGALDEVKNILKELIIVPLQRPELFSKGNLRKPCKGVLLFGPPGTGKTLLAKAVATESGANFISITGSSITSKWFGDAEKLTKALFTLARKLAPSIIFIDEVDSILGARGNQSEHEATRKQRNEFMAAWDGLQSKENERILVLATTNRPFDLDDAVIRRLPRRIFIDLPDLENRSKILHVILAQEDLAEDFSFNELARQTEGYSGSDLKNLCVTAAYRPVRELLEAEKQAKAATEGATQQENLNATVRPLCLEDFLQAKNTIGTSVAYDASSMIQLRRWNEQYGEGGNKTKTVFGFAK
eukprot:c26263_g1_i1 orf=358-3672(-)